LIYKDSLFLIAARYMLQKAPIHAITAYTIVQAVHNQQYAQFLENCLYSASKKV